MGQAKLRGTFEQRQHEAITIRMEIAEFKAIEKRKRHALWEKERAVSDALLLAKHKKENKERAKQGLPPKRSPLAQRMILAQALATSVMIMGNK